MESYRNYNRYLKDRVTSIARAYIYGELYHLETHDCPAIIDGCDKVYGQVIVFTDDELHTVLNQIDEFEKYFFDSDEIIYERTAVEVHYLDNSTERLSFYKFINKEILVQEDAKYISSGDWGEYIGGLKRVP